MAGAPEVASQDADTRLLEPTQRRARVDVSARAADSIAERLGGAGDEVARVGRHVILRELGRGGMGVVYAAYDAELDRKVAIKVLRSPGASDSHGRARMQREAQALAKLSHPNVVHVYDVGTYEGHVFLAMEYVEGETLDAWLAARPRPWPQVLEKFIAAGRGLAAAHAAGLVHRDFKPQNVIVGADARPRVLDFGLAKRGDESSGDGYEASYPEGLGSSDSLASPLTRAGTLLGTPAYMSPEQHLKEPATPRSDQFSFCVALYEGLYGKRPFAASNAKEYARRVIEGQIASAPRGAKVPTWLRRVIVHGLAGSPEARWPSMDALLAALARDPGRRWRRLGLAVGFTAAVASGGFALAEQRARRVAAEELACRGGAARLAGVWDDERRAALERSLRATGLSYADDVAARVVERLDALASTWVARYTAICERHRVGELSDEGLDRRMACLDERHGALRAVVDVLGTADADAVEKAVETAASVPAIDRCDDPTYLAASVRSPEDPATAAEVSRIQDSLAQARALILAGRYADGVERASAAVEEARAVAYAPLLAEALLVLGLGRVDLGEYQPAGELLADAYWRALGEGVDVVAAKAAARLAYLHGAQLLDFDAGRQWGRHGEALVRRLGDDRELAAELATSRGSVEVRARQLDAAAEHFTRAIELIDDGEAQPHPHLGRFHNNLAVVHAMRQRWADSERESRLARELMERTLGPGHPLLAHPHTNLGNALKEQGRFDEALALHRRALEIHERAAGPEHPGVAAFLINLAAVQRHKRDYDDAIATLGRALRVREAAFGPEHPQVANVHINLGDAHLQRGDYEEAARAYRRALEIRERAFGAEHEFLVIVLSGLGRAALELGDTREAIAQLERALALAGDATERKERAEARFGLARALHITGRTPERVAELAKGALEDFGSYGEGYRAEMDELARWQASPEAFERARAERVVQE